MNAGLELRDIDAVRGGRTLFSRVNLAVQPGQLLRVQGANGTGKTSLLQMICGLLAPARGRVLWQGQPVTVLREEFGRELVYLGHVAALKDELSPLENLLAATVLCGIFASEDDTAAALAQVGLARYERVPTRNLSHGQRQRAALARLVLASAAPLWVLDEPFNALDARATVWLLDLIGAHLARGGITVLTSHQDVSLANAIPQVVVSL